MYRLILIVFTFVFCSRYSLRVRANSGAAGTRTLTVKFCPDDIQVSLQACNDADTIVLSWREPTAGNFSSISIDRNFAPGSHFPVGETTTVTYQFQDTSGSYAICDFDVDVQRGNGVCHIWGDPHYLTFDGKKHNFQGGCEYTLVTPCTRTSTLPQFHLSGHNVLHPPNPSVSLMRGIRLVYNGNEYTMHRQLITLNGVKISVPLMNHDGVTISLQYPKFVLETDFGLVVKFDQRHESEIQITSLFSGVLCGLCGNFDGDFSNDFMLPDGSLTRSFTEFGNAWKAPDEHCEDVEELVHPCSERPDAFAQAQLLCSPLSRENEVFDGCNSIVDPDPYNVGCQFDLCALLPATEVLCDSLEEYASTCRKAGGDPGDWRSVVSQCPFECPDGMTYTLCGSPCQPTCAQQSIDTKCSDECIETCVCPDGQFLDGDQCVTPNQCGCLMENGIYISNGATFTDASCEQTCSCIGGELTCQEHGCHTSAECANINGTASCRCLPGYTGDGQTCQLDRGVCQIWGDPHYFTFDGRRHNFQGDCEYTLVKTCSKPATHPEFNITGKNVKPKPGARISYIREVHLHFNGNTYALRKKGSNILLNGVQTTLPLLNHDGVSVSYAFPYVILETSFGVIIKYNKKSSVDIYIPLAYSGHVCGLCGDFDGRKTNDLKDPDGNRINRVSAFGNSWSVSVADECIPYTGPPSSPCLERPSMLVDAQHLCRSLNAEESSVFGSCYDVVDPDPFHDSCVYDLCATLPNVTVMCESMEEYVSACKKQSKDPGDWRAAVSHCESPCPAGMEHTACGPGCPASCASFLSEPQSCTLQCIDSCVCPEGQVLDGDQCVPPDSCGCLLDSGIYLSEGESFIPWTCTDKCTCQAGSVVCVDLVCHEAAECQIKDDIRDCYCQEGYTGDGIDCQSTSERIPQEIQDISIDGCPNDMDMFLPEGASGMVVDWVEPTAHTISGEVLIFSQSHEPGTTVDEGTTEVTYIFRDSGGVEVTCSFQINVFIGSGGVRPTPAIITLPSGITIYKCPNDMTVFTHGDEGGTIVNWEHPTADSTNGLVTLISRTHRPEDFMEVGTTEVVYTFRDEGGNEATCSFTVQVMRGTGGVLPGSEDLGQPKAITVGYCPIDMTFSLPQGGDSVMVNWDEPTAASTNGAVTVASQSHHSGDHMTTGVTFVTYFFQDEAGVEANCSFAVRVLEAAGICEVWGDPHYVTFDGKKHNFQGGCEYTLIKLCRQSEDLPDFHLIGDNRRIRPNARMSYMRVLKLLYNGNVYEMRKGGHVELNGVKLTLPLIGHDGVSIRLSIPFIILETDFGLVVKYNRRTMAEIHLSSVFSGQVCGLCGNFDGKKRNDFKLPDGTKARSTVEFGNYWNVLGDECDVSEEEEEDPCSRHPIMQQSAHDLCRPLSRDNDFFAACHDIVDPTIFYEACLFDICAIQSDFSMLCESIEEYVVACRYAGVDLGDWTSQVALCATKCPSGMEFKECTSACPATCASPSDESSCPLECIDGCVCPEGQVLDGGRCVTPDRCGCLLGNGVYLSNGDEFVTEDCSQSCWCVDGQLLCDAMTCSENSDCEVWDGQRSCVCRAGYTGNGFSCSEAVLPGARPPPDLLHPITIENCPYDMVFNIPDDQDGTMVSWVEPTADILSGEVVLVNQTMSPGRLLNRGDYVVSYVFQDNSDPDACAVCSFRVVVTSDTGIIDGRCLLPGGNRIQSGESFISNGCTLSCSCTRGSLSCVPYSCGDSEVCEASDGERACICRDGFSSVEGECVRDCPADFMPGGSSCYHFGSKKNFDDAQDYCEGLSAYLAAISSREENDFVASLVGTFQNAWIGGRVDTDQEPATFISTSEDGFQFLSDPVPGGVFRIEFGVQVDKDAYIALSGEPRDLDDMYTIVLGGDQNTISSIHRCKDCPAVASSSTPNVLSPSTESRFYILVKDRSIEVGVAGEHPFLQWVDRSRNSLRSSYLGYATNSGDSGIWKFYANYSWINGEQWTYENWLYGHPSAYSQEEDNTCVEITSECGKAWRAATCSQTQDFICEM